MDRFVFEEAVDGVGSRGARAFDEVTVVVEQMRPVRCAVPVGENLGAVPATHGQLGVRVVVDITTAHIAARSPSRCPDESFYRRLDVRSH